jgi:1,4-alpha-glucan branching enzyme
VGVPAPGDYGALLNSDATVYGGSGRFPTGTLTAEAHPCQGQPCALTLTLPPLAVVFLKKQ